MKKEERKHSPLNRCLLDIHLTFCLPVLQTLQFQQACYQYYHGAGEDLQPIYEDKDEHWAEHSLSINKNHWSFTFWWRVDSHSSTCSSSAFTLADNDDWRKEQREKLIQSYAYHAATRVLFIVKKAYRPTNHSKLCLSDSLSCKITSILNDKR